MTTKAETETSAGNAKVPGFESGRLVPRMRNPALIIPEALQPLKDLYATAYKSGVPPQTIALVHLRASQINGCSFCVESGAQEMLKRGETTERIFAVGAWRDSPHFSDEERAALELAEAVTRLSDRPSPVSDEVWEDAARYYNERQMSGLLIAIATTNVFNRLNASTRQVAGSKQDWQD